MGVFTRSSLADGTQKTGHPPFDALGACVVLDDALDQLHLVLDPATVEARAMLKVAYDKGYRAGFEDMAVFSQRV